MSNIQNTVLELYKLAQSETPDIKRLAYLCADGIESLERLIHLIEDDSNYGG